MTKKEKKYVTPDPLVYMASMYAEYCYLEHTFVQNHQVLFGVKAELYNMVKAELDVYEGAWHLYCAACKKYSKYICYNYYSKRQTDLMEWGELLYGEVRYDSDKERKQYGIKKYQPKKRY